MSYRTICVSRDAGAAGEEIGHAVAESLGFRYVDEEIVRAAADAQASTSTRPSTPARTTAAVPRGQAGAADALRLGREHGHPQRRRRGGCDLRRRHPLTTPAT